MPASRSATESGADLMNWGRLPTTVSSLIDVARLVARARHALSVARRDLGPDLGDDLDERPRRRSRHAVGVPGDRDQAWRNAGHLEHGDVGALVHAEQRHDRVADPRADEALDDAALVGAKDDLGLEAARAEERLDAVVGGVAVADQRQPRRSPAAGSAARSARAPSSAGARRT